MWIDSVGIGRPWMYVSRRTTNGNIRTIQPPLAGKGPPQLHSQKWKNGGWVSELKHAQLTLSSLWSGQSNRLEALNPIVAYRSSKSHDGHDSHTIGVQRRKRWNENNLPQEGSFWNDLGRWSMNWGVGYAFPPPSTTSYFETCHW